MTQQRSASKIIDRGYSLLSTVNVCILHQMNQRPRAHSPNGAVRMMVSNDDAGRDRHHHHHYCCQSLSTRLFPVSVR